jgi:hypothetical protein
LLSNCWVWGLFVGFCAVSIAGMHIKNSRKTAFQPL